MRGREIEIELGAQQQLRRRLFFLHGYPHVVILSCDLYELTTKWTVLTGHQPTCTLVLKVPICTVRNSVLI